MTESAKKHLEAIHHLRKSPTPTAEHKDKVKEKEPNAVAGLVKGLAAVPLGKDGKVAPGFAAKANHPSVQALHPKSQQSKPQENDKPIAKTKPAVSAGKPVSEPKPATHDAKKVVAATEPVAKAKPVPHENKVSKPKSAGKEHEKPAAKAKPVSSETKLVAKAKHVAQQPWWPKTLVAKQAAPEHPALVARAYPALVPMPPKRSSIATAAVSTSAETEEQRAQKVQHALDDSEEAVKEVDPEIEAAKKEASEAHRIVHGK